ncbi:helicase-related protein [Blastomonas sp. CCH5-E3]|nr:helicase-related protein [Blastomonas sp. CCH5-E3]
METGLLFPIQAATLQERIAARRDSVDDRIAMAAKITPLDRPFVWWCNLNSEAEKLAARIPGSVNLHGGLKDTEKERILIDFSDGNITHLITKPSLAGFGMNWQHCADTGFVGLNDSFEQFYQAIRRFWRFGQTKPVNCHIIAAETEGATVANIRRKEMDADRMAAAMVMHMADLSSQSVRGMVRDTPNYNPTEPIILPPFLEKAA